MTDKGDDRTYQIIGAAMEVHKHLGGGFLEVVYGDALEIELQAQGIPYQREESIFATYRGQQLPTQFIPDFICCY